ncbi:RloB-like protein [Salegentibacter sp. 24]|uniref:RloB domain-containing protein n=1 Tax=Salegentibacter sp. 24 TaxID=2183986 RepID=UPI001060256F|nr:RloB domain-containing protein [Salegentibacter sp. 24]TDN78297.1 RloB-like protein [Salegentibacter sp. 24]
MARIRNKRNQHRKGKRTYSIIVDGKTEVWYIQMLKKNEDLPRIDLKPELPKKKKLSEQFESVIENSKIYDEVVWLIDFDTILKETREVKPGEKTALQELEEYKNHIDKNITNVELFVNTPCLELWILLHYEAIGKFFPNCTDVEKILKKSHIKDYEKSEKFYKNRSNDIYNLLLEKKEFAIENAMKLGEFNIKDPYKSISEMYKIFEKFGIKK